MTDSNFTALLAIVDRSGSMSSIKSDAEGGLNTLINDQKALPGRCTVRIVQFDDQYEVVQKSINVNDSKPYILKPRGSTALLDAVGKGVTEFGEELANMPESERPGKVIVVITTDGWENASREWSWEKVRDLVEQQKSKYAWQFIFIGANQDAVLTGAQMGIPSSSSITFAASSVGTSNVYGATSQLVSNLRSGAVNVGYNDSDRAAAVEPD